MSVPDRSNRCDYASNSNDDICATNAIAKGIRGVNLLYAPCANHLQAEYLVYQHRCDGIILQYLKDRSRVSKHLHITISRGPLRDATHRLLINRMAV